WASANVASRWRCTLGGFLAGVAAITRSDLAPALAISSLPLFLAMDRRNKFYFLIAGIVGLLPLIWITFVVGPGEVFYSLFVFPVFRLNPGRHLPIAQAPGELIHLLILQIVAGVLVLAAGILQVRSFDTR